jgi:O-antigen/teichoic acid export membrane protein
VVLFSQALHGKFWLSIAYALMVIVAAWISGIRDYALLWLLIIQQTGSSIQLFIRSYLTAAQLFRQDAIISIIDKLFVVFTVGLLILFPKLTGGVTIARFALLQIAGIFLGSVTGLIFLRRHVPEFYFKPFMGFRKDLFLASLPFALNIFLMTVMSRTDGFLLERLHPNGAVEAGIFAAGFRLLDAFNMVGFLMAGFLMPYIARHWPHSGHITPVLLACRHLLVLGSFWVASFALAAPEYLTRLLYDQENTHVAFVISMVLQALPALSMLHIYGTVLTATKHIGTFLRISFFYAFLSVLLNVIFIPAYGATACALIAVFIQVFYAITTIYFARRKTGIGLWPTYIPVYLSVGILSFTAIRMAVYLDLNIPMTAAAAGIAITCFFYHSAGISFRQLRQMLLEK